ncbi:hypothetical protein PanWU01x14_317840 [Parasponia andersonii]|uniref:Uncharacterized protein n=1 Tax=Parasponia andersonii TaxID=3476 RepID=A0A2P5AMG5_PARAD|nr:hypothetical protein PanWU01x14_317840 [Parasponia andersonii]
MEVVYGKKGSSSSSSAAAWPSRLSASAQPFTMNRHGGQPPALNSLANSKPFTPATSNHLDNPDTLLRNSFSNLTLEAQLQSVSADSALSPFSFDDSSDFASEPSFPRYSFAPSFQAYCDSSSSAHESLVKQDSKLTSYKVSTASDVLSSSFLQNVPQGIAVVKSNDGRNQSGRRELHEHEKSLVDTGKEVKNVRSVSSKGSDPLVMEKSEQQVTSKDIPGDLILEHSGTRAGIPMGSSSQSLDENDSDLDSPCWKGLQNSRKAPIRVSDSLNAHSLGHELEAGSNLNPQAPQFFPSHAQGSVDYFKNNFFGDCFPSFEEGECSKFNISYEEQQLVDSYKAGPKPPGLNNAMGYRHSNGIHERGKGSVMLRNSKSSSAPNSKQIVQPFLDDRVFTSKGISVTEVNVESFADRTKDAADNSPANLSALAMEYVPNLLSSGVGALNDCNEILQCLSQSLSKCPNINAAIINVMRYLSELLVRNCSNDLDSLNENEPEMIRNIINNLFVLIKPRVGEKTPTLDIAHTGSLDYPDKSTAIQKQSNPEYQVATTNGLFVCSGLDSRSDLAWQKSYPHVLTKKMQDVCSTSIDVGSARGNSIIPVRFGSYHADNYYDLSA